MSTSLYQATVPGFLQILRALGGVVEKGRAWCAENSLPDEALTEARLAADMWTFGKQVMASVQHSADAVDGVFKGETGPDLSPPPTSFAVLAAAVADGIARLEAVQPEQLDAIGGHDTCFRFGERRTAYVVEDYLLSFAQPNFGFHSAMAYAILRNQGVEIGKRDYLGVPRSKPA